MGKSIRFLIVFALVFVASGAALAQGPTPPIVYDTAPAWTASYWSNTALSGTPTLQRSDTNLDFNWGAGSPDPGLPANGFSARWTRYIDVSTAGSLRFTATADDGIRVWLDSELIINDWSDHAARTVNADRNLAVGHHLVTVEYYENAGDAVARVSWGPAPVTITHWRGEYFGNTSLSGTPALVRNDTAINFNWGSGAPAPGLPADGFSVRWTRAVNFSAGNYRFTLTVDDGARLYVNNHKLIDTWRDQPATTYTADIYLPAGAIPIELQYYENAASAVAQLSWAAAGGGSTPVPPPAGSVLVDDDDAGFTKGGSASGWRTVNEGYDGRQLWTRNNDRVRANYNWARWYPSLSARRYEVFVYVPERYSTTAQARYWVSHAGGYTLRVVDQSANGDRWVSLGTYTFRGTREDYVSLSDVTYEPRVSRLIAFDAVRWDPR